MKPSARIELVARRALDDRAGALFAMGWYRRARQWADALADVYGLPAETVIGVVAALSPLNGWESQLQWTPRILRAWSKRAVECAELVAEFEALGGRGVDIADRIDALQSSDDAPDWLPGPGLGTNKRKAARILCGENPLDVLSGPKVCAFFRNIMGDENAVCVDRHAWAIAHGGALVTLTPKRYLETADAFREASVALREAYPALADSLTPAGVQALTWAWWRAHPGDRC